MSKKYTTEIERLKLNNQDFKYRISELEEYVEYFKEKIENLEKQVSHLNFSSLSRE